jgi:hypothetical protein
VALVGFCKISNMYNAHFKKVFSITLFQSYLWLSSALISDYHMFGVFQASERSLVCIS